MAALEQTTKPFLADADKLEFGNAPETELREPQDHHLIIASYNIRYAVGRYLISSGIMRKLGINPPRRRSDAVERNITLAASAFSEGRLLPRPDILALQEADKETARAGGIHVTRDLARKLEMTWVHAPAGIPRGIAPKKRQWWLDFEEQIGLYDSGDTGVALLSRFPLTHVARIDLPWHDCAWRPRLALAASVKARERELRLFNAHIDPHPDANGQLEQLQAMIQQADLSAGPTIVMGDFNTLSDQKCRDARQFLETSGYTTPFRSGTPTWRGAGLRFHADWIFGRGVRFGRWGVGRPLSVSDHWPVWAEIEVL